MTRPSILASTPRTGRLAACSLAVSFLVACQASAPVHSAAKPGIGSEVRARLELPVAEPPFTVVKANWKDRLEQPYAFVELRGTYTHTARRIKDVLDALSAAGIEPAGAPFALFYDDPGTVPLAELRSRACVPVAADTAIPTPYEYDLLPQATVAYAYVGGPYGEVPRAYPGIFAFLSKMNWVESGPIREVYLVPPGAVNSWDELVCEVQIPTEPRH
jgi:effector-binding domain-containing protein